MNTVESGFWIYVPVSNHQAGGEIPKTGDICNNIIYQNPLQVKVGEVLTSEDGPACRRADPVDQSGDDVQQIAQAPDFVGNREIAGPVSAIWVEPAGV